MKEDEGELTDELQALKEQVALLERQVVEARSLVLEAYEWVYKTTGLCTPGTRFGEFCYRIGTLSWFCEYAGRFRLSEWGLADLPVCPGCSQPWRKRSRRESTFEEIQEREEQARRD